MNLLISLDFFGSYLHWYVNNQKKIYTRLGGVLTIISFLICIMILVFNFTDYINRKNPQITTNDVVSNEVKKISFDKEKIYIPWSIGDYNNYKINFTGWIYPEVYYYYREKDEKTGKKFYKIKMLNYKLCNETNLKNINYFQDNYVDFNELYCIEWDNLIMGKNWFHDFVYHIQFDFSLCENGVDFKTKGKKCTDLDKLAKYIGDHNAWHIEIYYPVIQFQPKNQDNPIEIFYSTHYYNFNRFDRKIERLYLKEFTMIDDKGWIFENIKKFTFWGFDKLESDSYTRSIDGNDIITSFYSSTIYSLVILLSRSSKTYTRKYTKLFDALGNILSIVNGIFILFKGLSQFFTEAYQDKDIVSNIFVQKYFMNEKYNEYNKNKRIHESLNLENIIQKASNQRLNSLNNNINDLKENKTIVVNKKFLIKSHDFAIQSMLPINDRKSKQNSFQINKIENLTSNKNSSKFIKVKEQSDNILNRIKGNFIEDNSLDHLKMKIGLNRFRSNFGLNIKNFQLDQIKDYMNKDLQNSRSQPLNNYGSKDFNFPYYLYLLNIFNKTFGITRMCCISHQFRGAWKYVIEVFDVVKFIELQTNIDLINKILFNLKIEEGTNSKNFIISQEDKDVNVFNNNNINL